jgi:phosphoglycolate phosphatase-like HAD superfamily hydrolase
LLALRAADIPFAIATSGRMETAGAALEKLELDFSPTPIVTRDDVKYAKPEPDLFLEAAERLHVSPMSVSVVGDSVWDMLAATRGRFLGVGVLSGGYGLEELERSGAYRVFEDPADVLWHLDELGGRR